MGLFVACNWLHAARPYYLKAVPRKRWTDKKVPEWTALLDDDRAD